MFNHVAINCPSYPFQLKVARQDRPLAGVHSLTTVEELGHEGRVEGIEVHRGHVVNRECDFVLQEVVTFVEENLQQHIDEVEEHRGPEKLLEHDDE